MLWIGRPDPKRFSWRGLVELVGPVLFITVLLMTVVAIALVASGNLQELLDSAGDWSSMDRWMWITMGISMPVSMTAAASVVVMLVSALGWTEKRKELYAITDRGFLWQQSLWPFAQSRWPVHRFSLAEVNALEVVRHADGTGTITFLEEWISVGENSVNPRFARIPDLDLALTIAYAAAEEAGIPPPERPSGWQVMGRAFTNWLVAAIVGSAGAVIVCLGAAIVLGLAIADRGRELEGALRLGFLLQSSMAWPVVAAVMFVTGFVGLWSLAVGSRLRRHPHLHRLRRLLAWLRVFLALAWLGAMAWIVLTLVAW
jgi:hypothetical protein